MAKKKESFREWRRRLGISVEQFARETKLCFSSVSKLDVYPDRVPREVYRNIIKKKYPLCPLVK